MTETIESIGEKLKNIGGYLGTNLTLDSRGEVRLSFDGDRACVLRGEGGFRPRIGMSAPLVTRPTSEQLARALILNADLERESGVMIVDDLGTIAFAAARDACNLDEEALAQFMNHFVQKASGLSDALRIPEQAARREDASGVLR